MADHTAPGALHLCSYTWHAFCFALATTRNLKRAAWRFQGLEGATLKYRGLGGPQDRPGAAADVRRAKGSTAKYPRGTGTEYPNPYRVQQGDTLPRAMARGAEVCFPDTW